MGKRCYRFCGRQGRVDEVGLRCMMGGQSIEYCIYSSRGLKPSEDKYIQLMQSARELCSDFRERKK